MRSTAKFMGAGACLTLALAACAACSPESLIYGTEGANVRTVTNELIADVGGSGQTTRLCEDARVDLGATSAWEGLAAGEPEEYTGTELADFADLSPSWFINLSPADVEASQVPVEVPTHVLYRGSGEELCVAGVSWGERAAS